MKSYLCFVYLPTRAIPELRVLPSDTDQEVPGHLAAILEEFPLGERLEVLDGERLVLQFAYGDEPPTPAPAAS